MSDCEIFQFAYLLLTASFMVSGGWSWDPVEEEKNEQPQAP